MPGAPILGCTFLKPISIRRRIRCLQFTTNHSTHLPTLLRTPPSRMLHTKTETNGLDLFSAPDHSRSILTPSQPKPLTRTFVPFTFLPPTPPLSPTRASGSAPFPPCHHHSHKTILSRLRKLSLSESPKPPPDRVTIIARVFPLSADPIPPLRGE